MNYFHEIGRIDNRLMSYYKGFDSVELNTKYKTYKDILNKINVASDFYKYSATEDCINDDISIGEEIRFNLIANIDGTNKKSEKKLIINTTIKENRIHIKYKIYAKKFDKQKDKK